MKLLGIAGTDGSGKDTVAELLVDKHGWLYISVTDFLREEAKRRGLSLQRNVLRGISSEWRRKYGKGVLVDMAVKAFESQSDKPNGLVIASLRHPGEADSVHELGGRVIWLDANPKNRYQRILSRNRGTEDQVTFEQFLAEESAQMRHGGDDATLNLMAVKTKADIFINNDSNNLEDFKRSIGEALAGLI
jgi:cytidylate kinase